MNIVISGPQGSGKGTQGKLLADKFGFYHLENGKILREIAQSNERIRNMLNEGVLVPDEEIIKIMEEHLLSNDVGFENVIFDGYPRNVSQYEAHKTWLNRHGTKVDFAVLLEISEQTTIERLSARRIRKSTGETFNLITNPPVGVPEDDLLQREDDQPEAIRKRLNVYNEQTKPLMNKYEEDGVLIRVNGEQSIEEIHLEIVKRLGL